MIIPWISSITALYFQLTVASSQAIRVTKMTSGLLYDVDKTDDDDTPTTLFSDGVSQPIVPIGEGTGGGATITSHTVTDWASGAIQTLSVTAGSTPVVQVIEDVPSVADANFSDVKLLLPFDSDFSDSSTSGHVVPALGNAAISTSEKKYGAGSVYFDGTGDYITVPDSTDWTFGSNPFTIEFYVRPQSFSSKQCISNKDTAWFIFVDDDNKFHAWFSASSVWSIKLASSNTYSAESWHHVALVRNGSSWKMYIDGVEEASATSAAASNPGPGQAWNIGGDSGGPANGTPTSTGPAGQEFNGYIDDFRLTKGVARYTANFAVPTSAHPTSASGPVISTLKFESDYKIDNAATDSVKVTKLSAGTANAKVKIIE
jgi:hypothetical protein